MLRRLLGKKKGRETLDPVGQIQRALAARDAAGAMEIAQKTLLNGTVLGENALLRAAELFLGAGRRDEAVLLYEAAIGRFTSAGRLSQAIAVARKIAGIAPHDSEKRTRLQRLESHRDEMRGKSAGSVGSESTRSRGVVSSAVPIDVSGPQAVEPAFEPTLAHVPDPHAVDIGGADPLDMQPGEGGWADLFDDAKLRDEKTPGDRRGGKR